MLRSRLILPLLVGAGLIYAVRSPVAGLEQLKTAREARLIDYAGPARIAVVWPAGAPACYVEGARAARDAVNAGRSAGSWPPPIELVEVRPQDPERELHAQARAIAQDSSIIAVIGHDGSDAAISASVTYDGAGLVFLAPNAMDQLLTRHMLDRVFQTTPTDLHYAHKLVELLLEVLAPRVERARRAELAPQPQLPDAGAAAVPVEPLRLAVVYPRSGYGEHFIETFHSVVRRTPSLEVVLEVPYETPAEGAFEDLSRRGGVEEGEFAEQLTLLRLDSRRLDPRGRAGARRPHALGGAEQQPLGYDVIVTPGAAPAALALITALRRFGITAPVVGTDALDSVFLQHQTAPSGDPTLPSQRALPALTDVYIASIFASTGAAWSAREPSAERCADFERDRLGVAGFVQVAILDAALASAGTRSPGLVAVKLKAQPFHVLGYSLSFDERGNIVFHGDPWVTKQLSCDPAGVCRFIPATP